MNDGKKTGKRNLLVFLHEDGWGRRVFKTKASERKCIDVDGQLYSITEQGEPSVPLGRNTADYWEERCDV